MPKRRGEKRPRAEGDEANLVLQTVKKVVRKEGGEGHTMCKRPLTKLYATYQGSITKDRKMLFCKRCYR
jgi:hypothetical protein